MAVRLFRCKSCGHRMRLAGRECGKCQHPKPILKSGDGIRSAAFFGLMGMSVALVTFALLIA